MRLLFKRACQCPISPEALPKPSFRITAGFDTEAEGPQIHATADFLCATCGTPWESYAGLMKAPKKPRLIIPK